MPRRTPALPFLALVVCVGTFAHAHHRQTPAVVALTQAGENDLPRVGSLSGNVVLSLAADNGRRIVKYKHPYADPPDVVFDGGGDNENPVVSIDGARVAFDSDGDFVGNHDPGRQVYLVKGDRIEQVARDPSGTSRNAALNSSASRIAFESTGDLAGENPSGALQIYFRASGLLVQASRGTGTSRNVAMSRVGDLLAFESSSDPSTGADTQVAQLWLASMRTGMAGALTAGQAPSEHPAVSADGRLVVFDTAANLAGDGADTGVRQVYVYDIRAGQFGRLTDDPSGCKGPSIHKFRADWRIAYQCGAQPFFALLRANLHFQVPIADADTTRVVAEAGYQFLLLATTADLIARSGTTPAHEVYLLNLYKSPPVPVGGGTFWFPRADGPLPLF